MKYWKGCWELLEGYKLFIRVRMSIKRFIDGIFYDDPIKERVRRYKEDATK
jgi:hypothetical protein